MSPKTIEAGWDNEDIMRWFEKLELLLTTKGIERTCPLAIAKIINNLPGSPPMW